MDTTNVSRFTRNSPKSGTLYGYTAHLQSLNESKVKLVYLNTDAAGKVTVRNHRLDNASKDTRIENAGRKAYIEIVLFVVGNYDGLLNQVTFLKNLFRSPLLENHNEIIVVHRKAGSIYFQEKLTPLTFECSVKNSIHFLVTC